ncbi:MAG TPA: M13 family metallopeptidase [Rhizomicrobium sp.]|nr:M13 family metallopeptidase [Rhizomicrobium sp.]
MQKRSLGLLAGALCLAVAAVAAPDKPEFGTWGVDLSSLDHSVKPGDDFFQFVNGNWLKNTPIPADRTGIGGFEELQILSEQRMKTIVADLHAKPYDQLSPDEKKLRDLYDAFLDQKQIEADGLKPVQHDLDEIAGLKTLDDVARVMASTRMGIASIFEIGISFDQKNSNAYAVNLSQGGLGLPDRDYYLNDDAALATTRDAYKKYIAQMLTIAGADNADARAQAVFDAEKAIAQAQWSVAQNRDVNAVYNPTKVSDLHALAPEFPWDAFLKETGIPLTGPKGERIVVVAQKSAFPNIAHVFATTPVSVWRDYLAVHYLRAHRSYLPQRVDSTVFAFYGPALSGQKQQLDRATRGVYLLDSTLGEALGRLYVAKYFTPAAKAKAEALVANLLKAYDADLHTLTWMSAETRQKALDKLHKFTPHIGYPDKWRDYSALAIDRHNLIGDVQAGRLFEWNREVKRLDDPVDKNEWGMTPPTINAYYDTSLNEIVFPAAILQAPFFDPAADDAVNYGGIGAVIGHEISHGFDDQGAEYDGDGTMQNWWTDGDKKAFTDRTTALTGQYDAFEVLPGVHVIGKNTLGENIADLAGATIALKAYHISLDGKPAPVLDGYTGDQRFFLSFAQIWRSKYQPNMMRLLAMSDVHSPDRFRANGVTRNLDAWYAAFDVKPTDKNYLPPEKRVRLW